MCTLKVMNAEHTRVVCFVMHERNPSMRLPLKGHPQPIMHIHRSYRIALVSGLVASDW